MFDIIKCVLTGVFVSRAVIQDIKEYKIKNKLVLAMLLSGLVLRTVFGGVSGLLGGLGGMLIPLALFPLFVLRMIGAGDIKALCAIGAVLGVRDSIWFTVISIIAGGVTAVFFVILRKNASERLNRLITYLKVSLMSRSLPEYSNHFEESAVFRFSYGIAGGYLVYVIMVIIKYLGG